MRTHTGEKRPTPKRKRLPLPVPEQEEKSINLEEVVLKVVPQNDSTQTSFTILETQTNNSFENFVEPTIIYEITETN
jgi:hypothetical protein